MIHTNNDHFFNPSSITGFLLNNGSLFNKLFDHQFFEDGFFFNLSPFDDGFEDDDELFTTSGLGDVTPVTPMTPVTQTAVTENVKSPDA